MKALNYYYGFFLLILSILFASGSLSAQCLQDLEIKVYGQDSYEICAGDEEEDFVIFIAGLRGTPIAYVVTDSSDIIVRVSNSSKVYFGDLPGGIYKAYAYSVKGGLLNPIGQHIDSAVIAGQCYERSINFVIISLAEFDAGTISTTDGETVLDVCTGDDEPNIIRLQTDVVVTDLQHYVLTDTMDNILEVLPDNSIDLNELATGVCRIYGVAASGPITAGVGTHILTEDLTEGCHDVSENYIQITKTYTDGAQITSTMGDSIIYLCPGNMIPDSINFMHTSTAAVDYQWLLTDDQDRIIELIASDAYDFENSPNGICRVYGVSYTGSFIAFTGFGIKDIPLSSGCFDISDNYIEIRKSEAIAGLIESRFGRDREYICPLDADPDYIDPKLIGSSNSKHAYIMTDTFGIIEGIFHSTPILLSNQSEGISRIYGLSYTGSLTIAVGDMLDNNDLSDDCFDLSSNFMELYKYQTDGATVSLLDGSTSVTLCVGDGTADILDFKNTSSSPAPYRYLITDENNRLTNVLGINFFNFEMTDGGTARIWGVSHTAMINTPFGENILDVALSDDCFDLSSNYIEVTKLYMGIDKILTTDGEEVIYTCPEDGQSNNVSYKYTGSTNAEIVYLVTSEPENIVVDITTESSYDVEGLEAGVYQVWALAYSGALQVDIGDDLDTSSLASGCSLLSSNALRVGHISPVVGTPTTLSGFSDALVCLGTDATTVQMTVDTRSQADFTYVVTDRNDDILSFEKEEDIDFSTSAPGRAKVYALSFTGSITAQIGDPIRSAVLTDDCFMLSDTFVSIRKQQVDGALVFTNDDKSIVYLCPDDTVLDTLIFKNTQEFGGKYNYVITDENFIVLGITQDSVIAFNNIAAGNYMVWGMSYTGDFVLQAGDHVIDDAASDACWDISTNFVSVKTQLPDWEGLTTIDGETTIEITVGDGQPDVVQLSDDGNQYGFSAYVVTNPAGTIVGFTEGNSIEFDGVTPGTCLIFGVAYTGELSIEEGKKLLDISLSTDCFDLSDNAVTVNKIMARPPEIPAHIPIQADYYISEQRVLLSSNSDQTQQVRVVLQDLSAKIITSFDLTLDQWYVFDLADYSMDPGIYFLSFRTDQYLTTQRVVVTP